MDSKYKNRAPSTHGLRFEGEAGRSRTRTHFKAGCSVDRILKQYATLGVDQEQVGVFRATCARMPYGISGDMTGDYLPALKQVRAVDQYFKALPSGIRERFGHEPSRMLSFLADPRNRDEALRLGLLVQQPGKASAEPVAARSDPAKGSDPASPPAKPSSAS